MYQQPDKKAFRRTSLDNEILPRCAYDIDLWARGYFGVSLFPYQRHFYHRPQKDKLLVAGIRTGKSEVASLGFLHLAQYNPSSRLLNTSISSEQAKIVFTKCVERTKHPNFSHWVEHIQSSPYPMIRLINKSELWFRSAGYEAELLRGYEFDVINFDEAAYCTRETTIKTLKGRLLGINPFTNAPRLGYFWMTSSPKGQGWLFERWKRGDPMYVGARPEHYLSLRATIFDNPLLSPEQIADTIADYTEAMIRQELLGEFLENLEAVFPWTLVMAACDDQNREVRYMYEQIKVWNESHLQTATSLRVDAGLAEDITHYELEVQPGHQYVSSWDLGKKPTKSGRNATVGLVYDITHEPWSQVAYMYREGMGYVDAKSCIERWAEKYRGRGSLCHTIIDSTGKGDVLQEFIERERSVDDLEGIVYSSASKPNLLHAGKIMLEHGNVRFPFIRRQVDQLTNYVHFDEKIAQDIVMAYCQAMYRAREVVKLSAPSNIVTVENALPAYAGRMAHLRMANLRYTQGREANRGGRARQSTQQLRRRR
jgi:hypothetical protein